MTQNSPCEPSDSWILLAVILGEGNEGATLRDILAAADYANHAIPTYEELSGGLKRLIAGSHVERERERYRPQAGVRAMFKIASKSGQRVNKGWETLSNLLSTAPPGEIEGETVTREAYERAVAIYLG